MITSITRVYSDLAELGREDVVWDGVTLETLLDDFGVDYRDGYKDMRDIAVYRTADENIFWIRFTHELYTVTLHEFHRWENRESGLTVVHQYRIRAEEEIHE